MVVAMCPTPLPEPFSPVPCLSLHWQGVNCQTTCWGMILWGYTINSVESKIIQKAWKLHAACLKRVYSAQLRLQSLPWSSGQTSRIETAVSLVLAQKYRRRTVKSDCQGGGVPAGSASQSSFLAQSRHLMFVDEIIGLINEWSQRWVYSSALYIS